MVLGSTRTDWIRSPTGLRQCMTTRSDGAIEGYTGTRIVTPERSFAGSSGSPSACPSMAGFSRGWGKVAPESISQRWTGESSLLPFTNSML
ncbi:hypothetical protein D3C76_969870 [compost metagenome]